jgi:hemerythrin
MAILWTDDLATKIDTIDNQHKMLFEIVNELLDSCKQGKGFEVVKKVVFFLDDYVKNHFSTEERYMKMYSYPNFIPHKEQHELFIKRAAELKEQFLKEGPTLSFTMAISNSVVNWLSNHIRKVDAEMAKFLKSQRNFKE